MQNAQQLVQKLWNYCNALRDGGMSYGDYIEHLPFSGRLVPQAQSDEPASELLKRIKAEKKQAK